MSVIQTVDIPASRRLTIDVPREIPVGRTILAFTPAPDRKPADRGSDTPLKTAVGQATPHTDALKRLISGPTPRADALLGAAAGLGDITLEEIRDERLSKYLT